MDNQGVHQDGRGRVIRSQPCILRLRENIVSTNDENGYLNMTALPLLRSRNDPELTALYTENKTAFNTYWVNRLRDPLRIIVREQQARQQQQLVVPPHLIPPPRPPFLHNGHFPPMAGMPPQFGMNYGQQGSQPPPTPQQLQQFWYDQQGLQQQQQGQASVLGDQRQPPPPPPPQNWQQQQQMQQFQQGHQLQGTQPYQAPGSNVMFLAQQSAEYKARLEETQKRLEEAKKSGILEGRLKEMEKQEAANKDRLEEAEKRRLEEEKKAEKRRLEEEEKAEKRGVLQGQLNAITSGDGQSGNQDVAQKLDDVTNTLEQKILPTLQQTVKKADLEQVGNTLMTGIKNRPNQHRPTRLDHQFDQYCSVGDWNSPNLDDTAAVALLEKVWKCDNCGKEDNEACVSAPPECQNFSCERCTAFVPPMRDDNIRPSNTARAQGSSPIPDSGGEAPASFDSHYEGKWKCGGCTVFNDNEYDECCACGGPGPAALSNTAPTLAPGSAPSATTSFPLPASTSNGQEPSALPSTAATSGAGGFSLALSAPAPAPGGGFSFGATSTTTEDSVELKRKCSGCGHFRDPSQYSSHQLLERGEGHRLCTKCESEEAQTESTGVAKSPTVTWATLPGSDDGGIVEEVVDATASDEEIVSDDDLSEVGVMDADNNVQEPDSEDGIAEEVVGVEEQPPQVAVVVAPPALPIYCPRAASSGRACTKCRPHAEPPRYCCGAHSRQAQAHYAALNQNNNNNHNNPNNQN